MLPIFNSIRDVDFLSVIIRMLLSAICGLLIGLERSAKNRPAGFRTHMLVCIGACAASMTGHYIYLNLNMPSDLTRLGAQVISGLGFIGAGTIIVTRNHSVKGLTTAAGLWTSGVIGLAFGAGFYEGAFIATVLVLFVELALSGYAQKIRRPTNFTILLGYENKPVLDRVQRYCKDRNISITGLQVTSTQDDYSMNYSALISLRAYSKLDPAAFTQSIINIHGVKSSRLLANSK